MGDEAALAEFLAALEQLRGPQRPRIAAERAAPVDLPDESPAIDDAMREAIAAEVSRQLRELMQEGLLELVAEAVAAAAGDAVEAELDRVTGP